MPSNAKLGNVPSYVTNVLAIAGGNDFSMALKSNGTVVVWGDSSWGQNNVPSDLTNAVAIAAGIHYCLALKSDGRVVGWGRDVNGAPVVPPADLTNVVAIGAGEQHRLALKSDGTLVAWGRGWGGTTVIPSGLTNVIAISVGAYHSLALKGQKVTLRIAKQKPHHRVNLPLWLSAVACLFVFGWMISRAFRPRERPII